MARTPDSHKHTPASPARQRCWTSMRVMRRFGLADIIATAQAAPEGCEKYVRRLVRCGLLRIARPKANGHPGSGHIYQLVVDTGPRAPVMRNDGTVMDPNTGRVHRPIPAPAAQPATEPTAPEVTS